MEDKLKNQIKALSRILLSFTLVLLLLIGGLWYLKQHPDFFKSSEPALVQVDKEEDGIENGIHVSTGFVDDQGMRATIQNCTSCHSAQLVTQNRMSREGWKATIKWMQETQNLWDLGKNEELILSYLAKNYAPKAQGRRKNLESIEWYELE